MDVGRISKDMDIYIERERERESEMHECG